MIEIRISSRKCIQLDVVYLYFVHLWCVHDMFTRVYKQIIKYSDEKLCRVQFETRNKNGFVVRNHWLYSYIASYNNLSE